MPKSKKSRSKSTQKSSKSKNDDLFSQVANKVLTETLRIKPGESITIETWNTGRGVANAIVKEARRMGAIPLLISEDEDAYVFGVRNAPKDVIGKMGKHEYALLSATDAYVFIPGPPIAMFNPMLTKEEASIGTAYNPSWYEAAEKAKLRGARLTFGYIGKEYAKALGKKPEDVVLAQLRSCLADFSALSAKGKELAASLQDGNAATISTSGSKLDFTLKGETVIEDGVVDEVDIATGNNISYMPGGLVQKEVDATSANGKVRIVESVTRGGVVKEATLTFENGKLTEWKAPPASKKVLDAVVGTIPEENRTLKFLTLGFNPELKFGNAHDRFVSGSIGIGGFGFTGIVRKGTISVAGKDLVANGKTA